MTQYNTLNVLKWTEVTFNLLSNVIGHSNDDINFRYKLLSDTQVSRIRKAFANVWSANIKFSKTQLSWIVQLAGVICNIPVLSNILSSVPKKGTDIARSLRKDFLDKQMDKFNKEYPLGKGSGIMPTNNEIKDTAKVFRSLENRWILFKGTTKKVTNQEGEFLRFFRPLIKAGLPLMKNVLTPLVKSILVTVRLTAASSSTDVAIQKKILGSDITASIISNEEMEDIMTIVKSLEESDLLRKGVSEAIKNEAKEQKGGFLGMLLGALVATLLGSVFAGKIVTLHKKWFISIKGLFSKCDQICRKL